LALLAALATAGADEVVAARAAAAVAWATPPSVTETMTIETTVALRRSGVAVRRTGVAVGRGGVAVRRTGVAVGRGGVAVRRSTVVVARPVRPWVARPHFGRVVGGVALGTIVAATAVGVVPAAPAPNLCWYWTDAARRRGYWDYCQ
jgi:hypothetical protein